MTKMPAGAMSDQLACERDELVTPLLGLDQQRRVVEARRVDRLGHRGDDLVELWRRDHGDLGIF